MFKKGSRIRTRDHISEFWKFICEFTTSFSVKKHRDELNYKQRPLVVKAGLCSQWDVIFNIISYFTYCKLYSTHKSTHLKASMKYSDMIRWNCVWISDNNIESNYHLNRKVTKTLISNNNNNWTRQSLKNNTWTTTATQ